MGEAVVLHEAELEWPNRTALLRPMTFTVPASLVADFGFLGDFYGWNLSPILVGS